MVSLDIEPIRVRARQAAALPTAYLSSIDRNAAVIAASAADVWPLLAEIERLRKEIAWITNAQHDELRAAGAELCAAEAERNDALQVIADLRGAP